MIIDQELTRQINGKRLYDVLLASFVSHTPDMWTTTWSECNHSEKQAYAAAYETLASEIKKLPDFVQEMAEEAIAIWESPDSTHEDSHRVVLPKLLAVTKWLLRSSNTENKQASS